MNIVQSPSPNHWVGRSGYKPEILVVHCTDGFWPSDKEWLRNPVSQVSSHYIISPTGEVHQLVQNVNVAWHAGRVDKPKVPLKQNAVGAYINPNYYSIGIEVSLRPPNLIPEVQRTALLGLLKQLATEFSIPIDRTHIVGHREIYSLKTCPGPIDVDGLVASLTTPTVPPAPGTNNNAAIKAQIIALVNQIQ